MVDSDRPLIGLNGLLDTSSGEPGVKLHHRYAEAVLRAGGIPVVLAPVGGPRDIERVLERIDGLVLTGGDDFDTERLGLGPTHPSAEVTPRTKQDYDLALTRAALEAEMPLLGICYGMQCMGLSGGSNLLQHLPEDLPGAGDHTGGIVHEVEVDSDSKLGSVLGVPSLPVISRHHQALSDASGPWRVSGRDGTGLIEAIEHGTHPFALGVQWHPELSPEGSEHDLLFRALVHASSMHRTEALLARSRS